MTRPLWLRWVRCDTCGSDSAPWGFDPTQYDRGFAARLANHREHGPLDADGMRRDMKTNLDWIARLPVPDRSILDAGCAAGVSRKAEQLAGWRWHGWDQFAFDGQDPAVIVADSPPAIARVGVVLLREVIEHVPDPVNLLISLHDRTLPGGWIQVQTPVPQPHIDQILYEPQHLRLYSPFAGF